MGDHHNGVYIPDDAVDKDGRSVFKFVLVEPAEWECNMEMPDEWGSPWYQDCGEDGDLDVEKGPYQDIENITAFDKACLGMDTTWCQGKPEIQCLSQSELCGSWRECRLDWYSPPEALVNSERNVCWYHNEETGAFQWEKP